MQKYTRIHNYNKKTRQNSTYRLYTSYYANISKEVHCFVDNFTLFLEKMQNELTILG